MMEEQNVARKDYLLLVDRRNLVRPQILHASGLREAREEKQLLELEPGVRGVRVAVMMEQKEISERREVS